MAHGSSCRRSINFSRRCSRGSARPVTPSSHLTGSGSRSSTATRLSRSSDGRRARGKGQSADWLARGASWGSDDRIIFATLDTSTGLLRVSANGGEPEALTTPDRSQGEVDHLWPELLPGGEAVLFTITMQRGIDQAQIAVLDLWTGARRTVLRGGSHAKYVTPGYLVYGVAGTLRAVAFNPVRLETVGAPVPVVEGVAMTPQGGTDVSVTDDGTLVYVRGQGEVQRTLVWVDRQGRKSRWRRRRGSIRSATLR